MHTHELQPSPAAILDAAVRTRVTPSELRHGAAIVHRGGVSRPFTTRDWLVHNVEAGGGRSTEAGMRFDEHGVTWAACDRCGHRPDWCRHLAAALFSCIEAQASGPQQPAMTADIEPDTAHELREHMRRIISSAGTGAAGRRSLQRQVQPLLEEIVLQLVGIPRPRAALTQLTILTEELLPLSGSAADGPPLERLVRQLGRLWAEALLRAELSADERGRYQSMLQQRASVAGHDGLRPALLALAVGWAPDTGDVSSRDPAALRFTRLRLAILIRTNRLEQALQLATAAELIAERIELLTRLGRQDEALTLREQQLTTLEEAHELAKLLHRNGNTARAIEVARRGLTLPFDVAHPDWPLFTVSELADWLFIAARDAGRTELALQAGIVAQRTFPSLPRYHQLHELAGTQWPDVRQRMLAEPHLSGALGVIGRVDMLLFERRYDEAIAALQDDRVGYAVLRVMDGVAAQRPDWVIHTALARSSLLLARGQSEDIAESAEFLRRARSLLAAGGRAAEWLAALQQLRRRHADEQQVQRMLDGIDSVPV